MLSKKVKLLIPVLALLALLTAYQLFASPSATVAHITLEVNPALVITINSENKVAGVELKEGAAQDLFAGVDFAGMDLDQALKVITEKLNEAGFLNHEEKVLLTVHPAEGVPADNITAISEHVDTIFRSHLNLLQVEPQVEIIVVDQHLYNAARKAGLWPSDYVTLVAFGAPAETIIAELEKIMDSAGLSVEDIRGQHYKIFEAYMDLRAVGLSEAEALEIINKASAMTSNSSKIYEIASGFVDMQEAGIAYIDALKIFEFGQILDHNNFTREISTLISEMIDLREVGISGEPALAALGMAVAADRSLKEVGTIISALIDFKEYGLTDTEALELVRQAIAADPSLKNLDDLFEPSSEEDGEDDHFSCDCDDEDKPNPDNTIKCDCDYGDNDDNFCDDCDQDDDKYADDDDPDYGQDDERYNDRDDKDDDKDDVDDQEI